MQIKKRIHQILVLSLLCISPLCYAKSPEVDNIMSKPDTFIKAKDKNHNQINLLFYQKSNTAKIIPNEGEPSCYNLVLTDTQHKIIYFSNEPARTAGSISLAQFLTTWQHNYAQDRLEPNVVVDGLIDDNNSNKNKEITDIAVFSHPDYDPKNNQLSYTACSISHDKTFVYTRLKNVSLFFDPFHRWPP